jgi:MraZ protein
MTEQNTNRPVDGAESAQEQDELMAISTEELAAGFVGNPTAKIDERGRLKMPAEFRAFIETKYGKGYKSFYITSTDGKTGELYPYKEWIAHMSKVHAMPRTNQARVKLLANYTLYGDKVEMDPQGRMQLPEILRQKADLTGEVNVSGEGNLLRITSLKRLHETAGANEVNAADFEELSKFGL